MTIQCDVLIVGAGPGGLACATKLASKNFQVVVVERKKEIGPKVCAGGITWDGLIRRVPERLIEKSFSDQYITSNWQQIKVSERNPIIATINRSKLGQWMSTEAEGYGAKIINDTRVTNIQFGEATIESSANKKQKIQYNHLVGADGSSSFVRKYLNIPTEKIGIGINYQLATQAEKMQWHLNSRVFGYGYGWIFPHSRDVSIGAYSPRGNISPATLKKRLIGWAADQGYNLKREHGKAALINYDYRGFQFGKTWLVGDAAGLASGLTGEGIFPAIISGEIVAEKIADPTFSTNMLDKMIRKQKLHQSIINFAKKNGLFCSFLMESLVLLLRLKIINFHILEMAENKNTAANRSLPV